MGLAHNMGVQSGAVADILNAQAPITPDMALQLATFCGNRAAFWLNLQCDYDLGRLEPAIASELPEIPTLREAEEKRQ